MSDVYYEYLRKVKLVLSKQYPKHSKKQIHAIARRKWKSEEGCGAFIMARHATLKYEVNNTLIARMNLQQYDMHQHEEWKQFCEKRVCIYCDRQLTKKKGKGGDHFFPVQSKSDKPLLSNFSAFTMPCCGQCNSSRGKKDVFTFIEEDVKRQANRQLIEHIHEIIKNNIENYTVDQDEYDNIVKRIKDLLFELKERASQIKIQKMSEFNDEMLEHLVHKVSCCAISS